MGCFRKMTNVTVVSSNKFWHKLLYLNRYRFCCFKTAFRSQKLIFQNKSVRLQRDVVTDWLKFAIFFLFINWLVNSSFEFLFSIIVLHYFVVHKFLFWAFRYPLAEAMIKIIKSLVKNTFRSPNTFLRLFRHQLADRARGAKISVKHSHSHLICGAWNMLFLTFLQTADRTRQPTVLPVKLEPINFRTIPKEIDDSTYEQLVVKINYFAKTCYFVSRWFLIHSSWRVQHTNCPWITKQV